MSGIEESVEKFVTGFRDFSKREWAVPPREEYELTKNLRADVVFRDDGDVIFHLFSNTFPSDTRTFLADLIEQHFGSTDRFSASAVPELKSWAILAHGLQNLPAYEHDFHVRAFLGRVAQAFASYRGT